MSYGTAAALVVIAMIVLLSHFLPKIHHQRWVDKVLPSALIYKNCPHCGKSNGLTFMDVTKSVYLWNPHENSAARHWCHFCHQGCDVRFFGLISLIGWLFTVGIIFFAWIFLDIYFGFTILQSERFFDQLLAFCFVCSAFLLLFVIDFSIKLLELKLLPYKRQI
jgi:hypothetical protein